MVANVFAPVVIRFEIVVVARVEVPATVRVEAEKIPPNGFTEKTLAPV